MSLTRRQLFAATAALSAGACGITAGVLPPIALPAWAQDTFSSAELAAVAPPGGDVVIGSDKAPVTIIEYASLTNRRCARFATDTLPKLKKRYIETGKVRYMVREFPLDTLAAVGFTLARCGGPDKYETIIETLFAKQADWTVKEPIPPLLTIAKQLGFSEEWFKQCLSNQKQLRNVEMARQDAVSALGVNSTPTFFINGKVFLGDLLIDEMAPIIDSALKGG